MHGRPPTAGTGDVGSVPALAFKGPALVRGLQAGGELRGVRGVGVSAEGEGAGPALTLRCCS